MGVVSVRLDDEDEAWLRKRNLKPGQFARLAVHEEIRRREIQEASDFLARNRFKPLKPAVDMIREDRDAR
jgi:hypothetical protein